MNEANHKQDLYEAWQLVARARNALRYELKAGGAEKALDLVTEANFLLEQFFLDADDAYGDDLEELEELPPPSPEDRFAAGQKARAILSRVGEIKPMPGSKEDESDSR